jgi:hypothetical protein
MLPKIARVRLESARDHVVVVEEVNLPEGEWHDGSLDVYVAFGAPGTPLAVDARIVEVPQGALESRPEDAGEPVVVEPVIRHNNGSQPLLGRSHMAGVVLHVKESAFRRALSASHVAALRVRSLLSGPTPDSENARTAVVRLGIAGGVPMTLGRLQIVSLEGRAWITRAEARLCGPEADAWPLSIAIVPRPPQSAEPSQPSIPPEAAVRHASDDLCVRWWTAP